MFSVGSFPKAVAMVEAAMKQDMNDGKHACVVGHHPKDPVSHMTILCLLPILDTQCCITPYFVSSFFPFPFRTELHYKFCLLLGHINRAIGNLDTATMHYQKAKEFATVDRDRTILSFIYEQLCIYGQGDNTRPLNNLTPLLEEGSLSNFTRVVLHQALANIYRSAADRHKSTTHFKIAIQMAKSDGNIIKTKECRAELGRAYRSSGCHSKALKRQKKFLDYATGRGDTAGVANACGYIGFTYYSMGIQCYDEAVKYLYCKLELSRNELEDSAGYRWCLNNIGKVYLGLKEYNLCIQLFTESGEIAKRLGIMLGLGTAYGNLGSACREVGKHDDAVKYHQLYLEIAQKNADIGGVAIMQRELILDHLYLYKDETDAEKKSLFLAEAGIYGFKALKTCLEIRSRLSNEDDTLKIGNFEHSQAEIYSLFLFIAIEQGQHEAGLVLSELGRAHALADRIKHKFKVNSSFLEDILAIVGSDYEIVPSALSSVLKKIGRLISRLDSHILVYSIVENPLHKGKLKEKLLYTWHVRSISGDQDCEVQVHFKQSALGLNMSESDDSLVDDYISSLMRQVQLTEAQLTTHAADQQGRVVSRDIIRRKLPAPKVDKFEELYDVLIDPMSQHLYGSSYHQGERLIVIPHGFLFGVPFCALKKQGRFLVEEFVICLSPSLYLLDIGLQREKEWSQLSSSKDDICVLAVGNPKMPESSITQLSGAEKEVNAIQSLLKNATVLCGAQATKKAVLNGFSKHSVIHLATHAIVEASLGDLAAELGAKVDTYDVGDYSVKGAVVLARSDSQCSGVLTSLEIEELCLEPSCELVILSCCKTGRGKITGDGILGLSRSLMCAGVMNMVVTRWPILDESTSLLMKYFYSHYAVNRDAPAALQLSMLHLIQNQYSVKQWAPFCCFGTRYT